MNKFVLYTVLYFEFIIINDYLTSIENKQIFNPKKKLSNKLTSTR